MELRITERVPGRHELRRYAFVAISLGACGPGASNGEDGGVPGDGSSDDVSASDGSSSGDEPADVQLAGYCVVSQGRVKCWGENDRGQLGLGDTNDRGDQPGEMGTALPYVDLGSNARVVSLDVANGHACALLEDGRMKCWGANEYGQLGLGDTNDRGDEPGEMGDALPAVDLGDNAVVVQVAVGGSHSCAVLSTGGVKCWGRNDVGGLGLGDREHRGDGPDEMGDALPVVDLGANATVVELSAGTGYQCARLADARVKCWGVNAAGQLGLEDTESRGDDPAEMGDALPALDLGVGAVVASLAVTKGHACALLVDGRIKCWGGNAEGQLGLGDGRDRGAEAGEMGDGLPVVELGEADVVKVAVGVRHSCALFAGGGVKCWGANWNGQLGLGDFSNRGHEDEHMGANLPVIDLGTDVAATSIAPHDSGHVTCAVLSAGGIKCWGNNDRGQLGLGDTEIRGDAPSEMGDELPMLELAL